MEKHVAGTNNAYNRDLKNRLLITDPYTPQSYDILLSLREFCEITVVAIPYMKRWRRIFSFTAHSKEITKVYYLESEKRFNTYQIFYGYDDDRDNKEKEYINEIIDICEREQINLIYPSDDTEVCLLSKHAALLNERGISLPINKYDILKVVLDKYTISNLAQTYNIYCPKTILMDDKVSQLFKSMNGQAIIKPRFGSAARDVFLINNKEDIDQWIEKNRLRLKEYIMQEYIPGNKIIYVRMYMKNNGDPLLVTCASCQRPEIIVHQSRGLVVKNEVVPAISEQIISLFRDKQFVGYGHAQLKVDLRDGKMRLLEVNARISRGTWTEMQQGINGPLLSLILCENRQIQRPVVHMDYERFFLWPFQDFIIFALYTIVWVKRKISRIFSLSGHNRIPDIPPLMEMLKHYGNIYLKKTNKSYSNYFKKIFIDPLVSICYWCSFGYLIVKEFNAREI